MLVGAGSKASCFVFRNLSKPTFSKLLLHMSGVEAGCFVFVAGVHIATLLLAHKSAYLFEIAASYVGS